ncbi:MAG: hypothetical protein LBC52_03585 [Treponema sp.]|jgi:hypothetical protein|nr:hypothetical protein [Treponema sp.]
MPDYLILKAINIYFTKNVFINWWSGGCVGGFYKRFRQGRAPPLAGLCSYIVNIVALKPA